MLLSKIILVTKEENIIKTAKLKFYSLYFTNFLIFIFSARRIYKKGKIEIYITNDNMRIREGYLFTTLFSSCLMIYIYRMSHKIYYNDTKYIIKKYCFVNEDQYKNAYINNKIAEMFKDKLNLIEQEK